MISELDRLANLLEALRGGDLSRLPELPAALEALPVETVRSALQAHDLQITGDGNIVGSGNVAIVVKGEWPELATRLAQLAEQTQQAEQAKQAANLFAQAAAYLERGRLREASAALDELRRLDPRYPGSAELLDRIRRAQTWRRLRRGGFILLGALGLMALGYLTWQRFKPTYCEGETPVSDQGILALAFQASDDGGTWWIGRSGEGLTAETSSRQAFYHAQELGAETVLALAANESKQQLWVGTSGGGLAVLRQQDGRETWQRYDSPAQGLPGCEIRTILLDDDRLVVGTADGEGLGISNDGGGVWRTVPPPPNWEPGIIFQVYDLARDLDGAVWVATNRGLYLFEGTGWTGPYRPSWVTSTMTVVRAVEADSRNVRWIGFENHGLALLAGRPGQEVWYGPIMTQEGLASDNVTAIALLPEEGGALVGTDKGLSICRQKGGEIQSTACEVIRHPALDGAIVNSIAITPDGQEIRVGTDARQLVSLTPAVWQAIVP